jgi:predicted RNase H-like HicB family nuclease
LTSVDGASPRRDSCSTLLRAFSVYRGAFPIPNHLSAFSAAAHAHGFAGYSRRNDLSPPDKLVHPANPNVLLHHLGGIVPMVESFEALGCWKRDQNHAPLAWTNGSGGQRQKLAEPVYTLLIRNEFTAVIERDGEWFVAWSPEIPGANGQGHTIDECRENLSAAIQLTLDDRRDTRAS